MRNQYKILAEKYSQVNEWATQMNPEETHEIIRDALACRSHEEFINAMKPYHKKYGMDVFLHRGILVNEIDKLPLNHGPGSEYPPSTNLSAAIKGALEYLQYNNKSYKVYSKKLWDEWRSIYKPYLDLQKDLAQKNKDTGINLDI